MSLFTTSGTLPRIVNIITVGGFLLNIWVVWIWRVTGAIAIVAYILKTQRKTIINWIGVVLIGIGVCVGPTILTTYSEYCFTFAIWFTVQAVETYPLLKTGKASLLDNILRVIAYASEILWQFCIYPPYGNGTRADLIADFTLHGRLLFKEIDIGMVLLSLIAIASCEIVCFLIKVYAVDLFYSYSTKRA